MKFGVSLTLCTLLCSLAGPALGGKWAHPAAGPSASGDPELLLTFDDGPHEKHSRKILDTLKKHGLQGLFFWTGHRVLNKRRGLSQRIALVERAVREGHIVQNHTTTHAKLCTVSRKQAISEIDDNAERYRLLTGLPQLLFRVPYGVRCKRLDKMLAERHLAHLHWDLDAQEFRHHSASMLFSYVTRNLRRLKPGKRVVLLTHDTQPATAKALPRILNWIEKENRKRAGRGKRPIRIISPSQFVRETHPVPLLLWLRQSLVSSRQAAVHALRRLVL